ncbi:cupin domain-containing protein [Desulfosediminicola sp.]|uniref:cupin domain-containing protein n=1 Tax=Desulfosediminicola sp. TaxID=2886825 RepID=UPI003AF2AD23
MNPDIRHTKPDQEFYTSERCHIIEISNCSNDNEASIARARVEPGITTEWHQLTDITERYLIISGTGMVEIKGLNPTQVTVGDVVVIPASTPQRITNTGDDELLFYAICTPRFIPDAYISLDGKQ